jgi:hypothetical protein
MVDFMNKAPWSAAPKRDKEVHETTTKCQPYYVLSYTKSSSNLQSLNKIQTRSPQKM